MDVTVWPVKTPVHVINVSHLTPWLMEVAYVTLPWDLILDQDVNQIARQDIT